MFVAIAIIFIAFWLRVDKLDQLPPGLTSDEAINIVDAFHITKVWRFPPYEDPYRPEPLFRIIHTSSALAFGTHIYTFRLTTVFLGILTLAGTFWAMRESLPDLPPWQRWLVALIAAGTLAVAIGPVTLQRTFYRANVEPVFVPLSIAFLLRGLRKGWRRDFILGGICLAAVAHSYLAGLVMPLVLLPLGVSLLIFRFSAWRKWLPNLVLAGVALAILTAPISYLLLTDSEKILGRVNQVEGSSLTLQRKIELTWDEFVKTGDINPQYNAESAPVIPRYFVPLFILGLIALVIRIRQPASALIGSMIVLSAIPVLASNEIPHGLRIIGAFGVFPLVIGTGVACLFSLISRLPSPQMTRRLIYASTAGLMALILLDAHYAHTTYTRYWDKPYTWAVFGRDLPHGLWFFRTDRRDFARWIEQQDTPLLVPVDELAHQTTRAWLIRSFPNMDTATESVQLPSNTQLVMPWALETGDLMRTTRQYALLQDGKITLLPPLAIETHTALMEDIDNAPAVYQQNGDLMLHVRPIPENLAIRFEPTTIVNSTENPLPIFNGDVQLVDWHGPTTLLSIAEEQTLTFTLDYQRLHPLWHHYTGYLAFHTQEYDRKAWQYADLWRWVYPSTIWDEDDVVSYGFTLTIPPDLQPGAYQLVAGMTIVGLEDRILPVSLPNGTDLGDAATIGWLKVPQATMPTVPESGLAVDTSIADSLALRNVQFNRLEDGSVEVILTWEALVERPDFDATIFVHALQPNNTVFAQDDRRPWDGQYPTFIWSAGEIVQTRHLLAAVQGQDHLEITVGMYTFPSLTRLAVQQNGEAAPGDVIHLGQLGELLDDGWLDWLGG